MLIVWKHADSVVHKRRITARPVAPIDTREKTETGAKVKPIHTHKYNCIILLFGF